MSMDQPVFAVDVGGVIANKQHEGQVQDGCERALEWLKKYYDLQIVSQCGYQRQLDTTKYLNDHNLMHLFSAVHYITFKELNKNRVLTEIGAAYFIDDRWKHVRPALEVPTMKRVFHLCDTPAPYERPHYRHVRDWDEVIRSFR